MHTEPYQLQQSAVHDVRCRRAPWTRYFPQAIIQCVRTEFNLPNYWLCSGGILTAWVPRDHKSSVDIAESSICAFASVKVVSISVQSCERCFLRGNSKFLYRRREKNSWNLARKMSKVRKNAIVGRIRVSFHVLATTDVGTCQVQYY